MANKSLVILPEAEHDITQTYTWYEEQEIGLGEEFLRCFCFYAPIIWRG